MFCIAFLFLTQEVEVNIFLYVSYMKGPNKGFEYFYNIHAHHIWNNVGQVQLQKKSLVKSWLEKKQEIKVVIKFCFIVLSNLELCKYCKNYEIFHMTFFSWGRGIETSSVQIILKYLSNDTVNYIHLTNALNGISWLAYLVFQYVFFIFCYTLFCDMIVQIL